MNRLLSSLALGLFLVLATLAGSFAYPYYNSYYGQHGWQPNYYYSPSPAYYSYYNYYPTYSSPSYYYRGYSPYYNYYPTYYRPYYTRYWPYSYRVYY